MKNRFPGVFASIAMLMAMIGVYAAEPVSAPAIFGEGTICLAGHDSHPAFSPDGSTLVFLRMGPDFTNWTLYVSANQDDKWSDPKIAPFSGKYMDADPCFTKDGKTLYFISSRPLKPNDPTKPNMNIWKIEKTATGWSDAVPMDAPINSATSEYYPTLTDSGTMYFSSRREGGKGGADIYAGKLVNGKYDTVENLGDAINTPGNEFEPFIAADESFLVFMATPTESLDTADFYYSFKKDGVWTKAKKLPEPFNSATTEFSPKVSFDGKYFFFSSSRKQNGKTGAGGDGSLDIYRIDFAALQSAMK